MTSEQPGAGREGLRDSLTRACFDPGVNAGPRGDRTTDQWRADALIDGPIAALIAERDALKAERDAAQRVARNRDLVSGAAIASSDWAHEQTILAEDRIAVLETDLAAQRARADLAEAENARLQDRVDNQSEALQRIVQWADAYPTDIFTPPDYPAIRRTLTANGFVPGHTLDGIAADCMRRATEGMGRIARAALAPQPTPETERGSDVQQP